MPPSIRFCFVLFTGIFIATQCRAAEHRDDQAAGLLRKATQEVISNNNIEVQTLARICGLQYKLGIKTEASRTLMLMMSHANSDGGGYNGPLSKLCEQFVQEFEARKYFEIIEFLNQQGLGTDPTRQSTKQTDLMIVNMIAKAAGQQKFETAESLLSKLSIPPSKYSAGSKDDYSIKAALWLNIPLIKNGSFDEAYKIAEKYTDEMARAFVYHDIYQIAKYEPKVELAIDNSLREAKPAAQFYWCRAKLDVALKHRKDGERAAAMLNRMNELGVEKVDYLHASVGQLLREEGKPELARKFLIEGTQRSQSAPNDVPEMRQFSTKVLARQFGESGDFDKAIELTGHWRRQDIRPIYKQQLTYQCQPLYQIAIAQAKQGNAEEATRIALSIKDNLWRADTLNRVGAKFIRKSKTDWLEFSNMALEAAKMVEPLSDRQQILGKVIFSRVDYQDLSFEQVLNEIEPLDAEQKSRVLGAKMEMLIRDGLSNEKVKSAIAVIEKGDTMNLSVTADRLLDRGDIELASDTMLKVELDPEYEFRLHNFFKSAIPKWSAVQQLEFISKATPSEQCELIRIALKEAPVNVQPKFRQAGLSKLQESKFNLGLMYDLFDHFWAKSEYDSLKDLLEIPLTEDIDRKLMQERLESAATERMKNKEQPELTAFSRSVKTEWCQSAITKARIKADIANNRIDDAIARLDQIKDVGQRSLLRILVAERLIALKAESKFD